MARRSVNVTVTGLDKWIDGFERLDTPGREAFDEWSESVEVLYDRTQQATHILSGALRQSGRMRVDSEGKQIVGTVTYGGTSEVDYAIYEFARGGRHDALTVGYGEAYTELLDGVVRAVDAQIDAWG